MTMALTEYSAASTPDSMAELSAESVLANRRWLRSEQPFPHVVAMNVFRPAFYQQLADAVTKTITEGNLKRSDEHDTMIHAVPASAGPPLSFLFSREWQDLLGGIFDLPPTGEVTCAIHHHLVGSGSGYPHNDLRRDWVAGTSFSQTPKISERPEAVRGVAVLLYLANEPWRPEDGGETCLYRSAADPVDRPMRAVPPINNTLLAFPCSPISFHAFRGNRRNPRNSIVMWTYQRTDELLAAWQELLGIEAL
jgi:hypothetical protein